MIAWDDIFKLIKDFFEVSQSKLAEYLPYSKATLSRIKNGKQNVPDDFISQIYENIFNPTSKFCKERECTSYKVLLCKLNGSIEYKFGDIKKEIEPLWIEEPLYLSEEEASKKYEEFVITLLHLAKQKKNDKSCATTLIGQEDNDGAIQCLQNHGDFVKIVPLDHDEIEKIVRLSGERILH